MIIQTRWTSRVGFDSSFLESIPRTFFQFERIVPDLYDSTLINAQDIHSQEQESIEIDEHEDEILLAYPNCLEMKTLIQWNRRITDLF